MPFDGDNQDEVFNKIKAGKFNINVDLSEECKDLLKKMIMVDVNKRINIELNYSPGFCDFSFSLVLLLIISIYHT